MTNSNRVIHRSRTMVIKGINHVPDIQRNLTIDK
jgi:hypothetical protein